MNTHSETILIVDDEPIVRNLLSSRLAGIGYACLEAPNAEAAMEQLKTHRVALALLDIMMPGESGLDLLEEMSSHFPDTAVVMVSAVSNTDTAVQCMARGAYDYIAKPFDSGEVALRIEYALERRKLRLDNHDYQLHLEARVEEETERIRSSEENFRRSMDNSPLGIRIVSADGRTIYANAALLGMYRYSSVQELNALPTHERYTPESYTAHLERLEKRRLGEFVPSDYEIGILRNDGAIRHLLVSRRDVLWDGERQFQVLYQDITERVHAERALAESNNQLRKTLDGVIQSMALTVELRDAYTAGHQRHVAGLASAIAVELGLDQESINGIRVAGIVHDIGKICVPAEILSKPGRITEAEFNIIKEHPKTGYTILKEIDFPWPVAQAVLQHHERMNGSGYPGQLSGEGIIAEARILAVSDVVEAMASHRPYRPALGIDKALQEVSRNRGVLYDSDVVDACLRVFAAGFKVDSE